MDLTFDTETTGFAKFKSPDSDPGQPHLVQIAVILSQAAEIVEKWDTIVMLPESFGEVPEKALKVHGIDKEKSLAEGIPLVEAINKFQGFLRRASRVICHNTKFDSTVIKAAYYRAGISSQDFEDTPSICTMLTTKDVLKIPHPKGWASYKWPTLLEAYQRLVDEDGFEAAHSADADTMACWKILIALEKRGVKLI